MHFCGGCYRTASTPFTRAAVARRRRRCRCRRPCPSAKSHARSTAATSAAPATARRPGVSRWRRSRGGCPRRKLLRGGSRFLGGTGSRGCGGAVGFPRALAEAEALITALDAPARSSVTAQRLLGGVALRVRVLCPAGLLTRELIAAVQATRIPLAPHDPSVTASLFLRPGSSVEKVAPLSYYGGGVAALSGALGAGCTRVVASPDMPAFRDCVTAVAADGWAAGGPLPGVNVRAAAALVAAWDAAADANGAYGKLDRLRLDLGVGGAEGGARATWSRGGRCCGSASARAGSGWRPSRRRWRRPW